VHILNSDIALLVRLLGLAQLGLAGLGFCIPRLLDWKNGLANLTPMLRRLFWVYGLYIFFTNLFFALVFLFFPGVLERPTPAAGIIAGYLTLFWGARFALEMAGFDRDAIPPFWWARWGSRGLMVLFGAMTIAYGWLTWRTLP